MYITQGAIMRGIEEQIVKAIREQRFLSKGRSEFYSGIRDRLNAVMSAVNIEGHCNIYKGQMRWVIDEGKQANGWTVRVM